MNVGTDNRNAVSGEKAAHDLRFKRILDCVALKQPDRTPVAMYCTFWLAKYGNVTNKELGAC